MKRPPPAAGPFVTPLARQHSAYSAYRDGGLVFPLRAGQRPSPVHAMIHESFRRFVLNPRFACLGARSAVHRATYRLGVYPTMATSEATAGLAHDLHAFVQEFAENAPSFTSFIAAFTGPIVPNEQIFESALWSQLQALHHLDAPVHRWDPTAASDPADPEFSFSFAGQAFFVVGLHPASSRWTRRFGWPVLVFNRHDQFVHLRRDGRCDKLRRAIRERDQRLQGSTNPMMSDFGTQSEARQYSGRAVDAHWVCPFQPETAAGDPRAGKDQH